MSVAQSDTPSVVNLDKSVQLGQLRTTLSEIDNVLAKKLDGIRVTIKLHEFETVGISPDAPVRATIPRMPLRSALRKLLQPHGLHAVVADKELTITPDFTY